VEEDKNGKAGPFGLRAPLPLKKTKQFQHPRSPFPFAAFVFRDQPTASVQAGNI
jgi:hypothetical protein